jgi:hypothetical protein
MAVLWIVSLVGALAWFFPPAIAFIVFVLFLLTAVIGTLAALIHIVDQLEHWSKNRGK